MKAKITAVMFDGTRHDATGDYMALADRVAYERRFGMSAAGLAKLAGLFDPKTGEPRPDADLSEVREEWTAFFGWRLLKRSDQVTVEYDEFLESVADLAIDVMPEPANPTDPVPQPTR